MALAARVRVIWLSFPLFFLWACKETPSASSTEQDKTPPKVSFSKEVRPLLLENCLSCHQDFPLHSPTDWDLLHTHKEGLETPELLKRWLSEGGEIDPHWALLPLREVAGTSVDDFIEPTANLRKKRKVPEAMFSAPVVDLLAGDLMADSSRTVSTGYLRREDDSPQWRAELVAREFLGVNIACARCHDHPGEDWTTERYQKLTDLFTTPYDHLPKSLPPLFIKKSAEASQALESLKQELKAASVVTPPVEQDYLDWLESDEGLPSLSGLVAAYSFEGNRLHNLALASPIKAEGHSLIMEGSAHGEGLLFTGENKLSLSGLPITSELDPFTFSVWIKLGEDSLQNTPIARIGSRERGFEFLVHRGRLQARWSRFWPQFAISVSSKSPLIVQDRWSHVAVSYDGTRLASGLQIYLNGLPVELEAAPSKLMKSVLVGSKPLTISGKGLSLDELQIYRRALSPLGIKQIFDGRSLALAYQNGDDLREFYQRHHAKNRDSRQQKIRKINESLLQIENDLAAYLVMASQPPREEDSVSHKDPATGAEFKPKTSATEIQSETKEAQNRLEFAQGLNKDLLARSLANEVWRRHFGHGLTTSLGLSAPLPAHGHLLEWLAGELKKNDFKINQLGELIRRSSAWKQEWTAPEMTEMTCPRPAE